MQAALYGRADAETCSEGIPQSQLADTKCSQEGTVKVLQSRYISHGIKQKYTVFFISCILNVANQIF